ncbi:MAG: DMT family transporter [Anaerovoracaceae bacterium]|jgi:drug/metabolite transporter (DMT)-like permease
MKNSKALGISCIIGTTICYGLVPSLSFLAFRVGVATETLLFNKFLYAAILMWIFILARKVNFRFDKKSALIMAVVCVSYIGLATTLYCAFDYISGSLATIVSFTFPAIIIAIEMISGREPVRIMKILAVILSMAGLVLIVWSPDIKGNIVGIAFAFGTALCYVAYLFGLGSRSLKKQDSFAVSGYVLLSSAVFNGFRCGLSGHKMFALEPRQFLLMILLAVVCAFLAILMYAMGVKMIGPGNAALINTFEPVLACIFGFLLVGDVLTHKMLIGAAMVVAAVLIANLPSKKDREGTGPEDPAAADQ